MNPIPGGLLENVQYSAGAGLTLAANTFSISSGAITNAMLAGSIAASNLIGTDIATVGTISSGTWAGTTIAIAHGGTGATTATAGFNALSPMTTAGDLIYGGASGSGTRLAANATATNKYLQSVSSGNPAWVQVAYSDLSGNGSTGITTVGTITTGTWTGTTIAIANGGTGQTTASAAFNALSPLTTAGDVLYGGASGAGTRLGANSTATKKYLQSVSSGNPSWQQINYSDLTGTPPGGTFTVGQATAQTVSSSVITVATISVPNDSNPHLYLIGFQIKATAGASGTAIQARVDFQDETNTHVPDSAAANYGPFPNGTTATTQVSTTGAPIQIPYVPMLVWCYPGSSLILKITVVGGNNQTIDYIGFAQQIN